MTLAELEPLLWLSGFTLFLSFHLFLHPLGRHFRQALRALKRNPAPFLVLAASHIILGSFGAWPGVFNDSDPPHSPSAGLSWQTMVRESLLAGWHRLALLFHHAIIPPPPDLHPLVPPWAGAALQAVLAAASQIWLCRSYLNTRSPFLEDWLSFRQTLALWPSILFLAILQFPWWFLQNPRCEIVTPPWLRHLLLPEYLLFLAPLPLALASSGNQWLKAGHLSFGMLKKHLRSLLLLALSAIPTLTLLHFGIEATQPLATGALIPLRIVLGSLLLAFFHLWLYLSAASLLLSPTPPPRNSPAPPVP